MPFYDIDELLRATSVADSSPSPNRQGIGHHTSMSPQPPPPPEQQQKHQLKHQRSGVSRAANNVRWALSSFNSQESKEHSIEDFFAEAELQTSHAVRAS